MRILFLLATASTLAACSGGGPQTAGGNAPPQGPVGTPGQGGSGHSFVAPTELKTYSAIGGVHSYRYNTQDNGSIQSGQLYAGDATTARNSGITVTYDPRDAIFTVAIDSGPGIVSQSLRFQDPVHRTDFGGAQEPQGGTPELSAAGVLYLEAGSSSGDPVYGPDSDTFPIGPDEASRNIATFFYQKPGTETRYVTFAGFVRNATTVAQVTNDDDTTFLRQSHILERGAFAYGERSQNNVVPRTGTGTFTGPMAASMVFNPLLDTDPSAPTYFQWIDGRATTTVDFAANSFTLGLTGTVMAPQFDIFTSRVFTLQEGAAFSASGAGRVDLAAAGGFLGQFDEAFFTQPGGARLDVNIAGSSIDGAFFGPNAEEVGGGFRIVGGTPDERIDILGAFTGAR